MEVTYDVFAMPGEPELSVTTYTAEVGTETADKLALLRLGSHPQRSR